ncbi:MAG: hypothetical protein ACRD2P_03450 [Terriglobia bacterium]
MSEPIQNLTLETSAEVGGGVGAQLRLEIESMGERLRALEKSVQELRAQFERTLALARQSQPRLGATQAAVSATPDLPPPEPVSSADQAERTQQEAKRYAWLLVSEIELYNPADVAEGREKGDLYPRLKVHIERSRKAYENRFGKSTPGQPDYFHEEIVRVLAQGDAALLGPGYPFHFE